MNLAMTLTLDGLVRALRRKAHALADEAEHGYRRDIDAGPAAGFVPEPQRPASGMGGIAIDRSGR